jgi:DNA (cytosine-5)-methyltransferase 1
VCEQVVEAAQYFKPSTRSSAGAKLVLGQPIGTYRDHYYYTCPRGHAAVEPFVRPAASVIDWSNLGRRIGDRKRPLAASTMARIRAGLAKYPTGRTVVTVNHAGHDGRAFPVDAAPLPTRSTKVGEGILVPTGGTWNTSATSTSEPMRTRLANPKGFEALVTEPFVVEYRNHADAAPVTAPLATVTAGGNHHGLVIPYRNANPRPADQPLHTLATRDSAAIVRPAVEIEDCYFRMLGPREQLGAQRFPGTYVVHGNQGEQTAQAGNAVSVNAARFIGTRLAAVL